MSLVSTLGKMAVGILVAKGVSKMVGGGSSSSSSSGGGLGGLLGSLAGGGQQSSGGLGGMLGGLMGGGSSAQQGGGLGDLLGNLGGSRQQQGGMGGLGDLLGNLTGGSSSQSGGGLGDIAGMLGGAGGGGSLGGILDSLSGGNSGSNGGLGSLLNDALQGNAPEQVAPDQEQQAEIMLRAIIQAAKADGDIDDQEKQKIAEHLDDVTEDEVALVRSIMAEPSDVQALINSVPKGMEQQVYFMSLLAIDIDTKAEAQYLHQLAQGLNISAEVANHIHEQAGEPKLYS